MPWSSIAPPGTQPPLGPAEMDLLVARTGLTLNPGQMADLVLAWRQLAGLIAAIPRSAVPADDQAFVFRLPPPAPPQPARKPAAKPTSAPGGASAKKPAASRRKAAGTTSAAPARKR